MTAFSSPNRARHTVAFRTPFSALQFRTSTSQEPRQGTACARSGALNTTHGSIRRAPITPGPSTRPDVAQVWNLLNATIRDGMDRRRFELATIAAARVLRSTY
jgi:hypothetical protein